MSNSSQQTSNALVPPAIPVDVGWLIEFEESQKPAKTAWPDVVVGMTAAEAFKIIKEEEPQPHVAYYEVVREGEAVTFDLRHDRVRFYVDDAGKVAYTPSTG
ncbi:hypothetical protein QQ045_024669 [Rhodiola kirilowii]